MKWILAAVNAKYIHTNLAVYSMKACASEYEDAVEIAEYTINQETDEILRDLYVRKPDVIGFSCYLWNINCVRELSAHLAKIMPGVPIWLGGPEVSYDAQTQLEEMPQIKGIMTGEGEETFLELMAYYHGRKPALSGIAGLCFREEGQIVRTPSRPLMDLNRIPFPYPELCGGKMVRPAPVISESSSESVSGSVSRNFAHKILYYESSRGCPFSCSYCLSSLDRRMRFRDMEQVKQDLSVFLEARVPQVKLIDRTFNCNRRHAMAVWTYLAEHDNGVTNFHFEIAADLLDDDMVTVLSAMRPGQVQLEIGVQTTCPETIAAIERRMDLGKVAEMVVRVRAGRNIHQHLDLIAGLPMEGYMRFGRSFDQVYAMGPDQLQLGFLKVLKGSSMEARAGEYGLVSHDGPPYEVLFTRWISYEEIQRLKRIAQLVELYYNSGQFSITLKALGHRYPSAFRMFEEMAEFFEQEGFFRMSPGREARYERLRQFLAWRFPGWQKTDCQLLTWDCYLRENLKKHPAFAPGQERWKKEVSDFFAEEAKQNRYFPHYKGQSYRQLLHQVHLEVYTIDIPALVETGMVYDRLQYVCYDYGMRDVLNYNSHVTVLETISPFTP